MKAPRRQGRQGKKEKRNYWKNGAHSLSTGRFFSLFFSLSFLGVLGVLGAFILLGPVTVAALHIHLLEQTLISVV